MNNPANALIGPGGAPTRATTLPDDAKNRKRFPIASGVLDYFPDAIVALAEVSWRGNEQHNPGKSLRWDRAKSGDESDTMMRHFLQRGTLDTDGMRHSAKLAWRALALLQKEIEEANKASVQAFLTAPAFNCGEELPEANGKTVIEKLIAAARLEELEPALSTFNHGTGQFEELAPKG